MLCMSNTELTRSVSVPGDEVEAESVAPAWSGPAKRRMQERGLTQQDLINVFDVRTRGAVGHYFRGRRQASMEQLRRLSEELDLDLTAMVQGKFIDTVDQLVKRVRVTRNIMLHCSDSPNNLDELSQARDELVHLLHEVRTKYLITSENISSLSKLIDEKQDGPSEEKAEAIVRLEPLKNKHAVYQDLQNDIHSLLDIAQKNIEKLKEYEFSDMAEHIREMKEHDYYVEQPVARKKIGVPIISWVQAGSWEEATDTFHPGDADKYMQCPAPHSGQTFALRVEGDSMTSPTGKSYPSGAIIFVDPEQRGGASPGDRVIAKIKGDDKVTFKQLAEDRQGMYLKPLNPSHEPIYGEFSILGKVIGMWIDD